MSKDKGTKNHKKAPASKTSGKIKVLSAYKSEGKSSNDNNHTLEAFMPKTAVKPDGKK